MLLLIVILVIARYYAFSDLECSDSDVCISCVGSSFIRRGHQDADQNHPRQGRLISAEVVVFCSINNHVERFVGIRCVAFRISDLGEIFMNFLSHNFHRMVQKTKQQQQQQNIKAGFSNSNNHHHAK